MPKNILKKIINDGDVQAAGFNLAAFWLAGKIASTVSNAFFHFDLNKYNSIDHLAIGVGIGTLAYRKAGGGLRGVAAGLAAGTVFNASWEPFENLYILKNSKLDLDTVLDISVVYAGNILSFAAEKAKRHANKSKMEKWVL
jgi:hypothetical protein